MEALSVLADTCLSGTIYLFNDFLTLIFEMIEGEEIITIPWGWDKMTATFTVLGTCIEGGFKIFGDAVKYTFQILGGL